MENGNSRRVPDGAVRAVLFDLDGVIVATDDCHYRGWQRLADEENIPFDRSINERLRGVSRMGSLEIVLERSDRQYNPAEKEALCARKNGYYCALLAAIGPADILPGVLPLMGGLRARGVRMAVASSSRNTQLILRRIKLAEAFDAVADGNDIAFSKPHPEVFLLAAQRAGVDSVNCLVVEDAAAGVEAGLAAGMRVLGVGSAAADLRATARAPDLSEITADFLLGLFRSTPP